MDMPPIFFDHSIDKYASVNEWKYNLGRMCFYQGRDSRGNPCQRTAKIIDFNKFDGKPMPEVKTLWDQPLLGFHRDLFAQEYPHLEHNIFHASDWLSRHGARAKEYYRSFLLLFIRHGILFENLLLEGKERTFVREVFLPAFVNAWQETGYKPLITALEPTDIEGEDFWLSHPHAHHSIVQEKLNSVLP
jgi:hypothetical protein